MREGKISTKVRKFKIAIIGAGASGLSTAYELQKFGFKVDIFEKSNQLGGLAGAVKLSKGKIDSFYHHLFKSDKYILSFLEENNLNSKIKFKRTSTGHSWNNKFFDISSILSLWNSKLLSNWGLLRLLFGGAVIKYLPSFRILNEKMIYKINDKLFGKEAALKIWNPLLNYKFGKFSNLIPYSWLRSRIQDRTIELGYLSEGFETIYDFLEKKIISANGNIYKNCFVKEIGFLKDTKQLLIKDKVYDRVVLTTPPSLNKKLLKKLSYKSGQIEYLGALCGIIEFDKKPISAYWTGIADIDKTNKSNYKEFLAAISYAELDDNWNKKGKPTWPLYLVTYCSKKQFKKFSTQEWKKQMTSAALELNKLTDLEEIKEENIIDFRLSFAEYAQPILSPGKNLYPNPESANNCYFANMHNIFPNDRGQNRSFYLGKKIAKEIFSDFSKI